MPDFLFEIEYSNPANAKFYETKGERDLIYAFHGSRLENFHSIIHNGLHCHLNKVGPKPNDLRVRTLGSCLGEAGGDRFTEATLRCGLQTSTWEPVRMQNLEPTLDLLN